MVLASMKLRVFFLMKMLESKDEQRFVILGLSNCLHLLVVCHCYRKNDEIIRIISARKATRNEAKTYEEY